MVAFTYQKKKIVYLKNLILLNYANTDNCNTKCFEEKKNLFFLKHDQYLFLILYYM